MSVLDRSELEQSHLADLHAIASELGIEDYRRLSRDALIDAILAGDGGDAGGDDDAGDDGDDDKPAEKPRGRGRRLRRRRGQDDEKDEKPATDEKDEPLAESDGDDGAEVVIDEGDDSESTADEPKPERDEKEPEDVRTGVLDILPGGSGFMREDAFVHAREDVYVSPAQIRRCELRAGDELSGPVRPPRRSERYPSLVRVETVNGQPADAIAERANFDELTPTFATEALETVHGLPFGKGSRLAIGGPPGAGATRLLREVTDALEGDLDVLVVLAGVRPEEVTEWKRAEKLTVAGGGFDRPPGRARSDRRDGDRAGEADRRARR